MWTKDKMECDVLTRVFGGSVYKHRAGHYWIMGNEKDLLYVREKVLDSGCTVNATVRILFDYLAARTEASETVFETGTDNVGNQSQDGF